MKDYCRISDFNNTTDNNGTCGVDEAPSFGHFGVSDIGPDVAVSKLLLTGRKKYKAFLAIPVKEGLIFYKTDSGLKQITYQYSDWQPLALALALAGLLLLSVIGIAAWRKSKGQRKHKKTVRLARPDYRHGGTASTCDNSHVEALDEGFCQEVLDAPFVSPDVTSAVMQPPEYDSVTQPAEGGPVVQPTESGVTQPAVHGPGGPVVQPAESGSIMQSAVHGSIMQQAELGPIIQPAEYGTIMQPVDNGASVQPEH